MRTSLQQSILLIVLLVLIIILLHRLRRNPVQIPLASLTDAPPAPLFILLQDADLFQTLHDLAVDTPTRVDVMTGPRAAVLGAAVDFAQTAHAHRFAQVDVSRHRGGADVVPIYALRGQFFGRRCFHRVDPACVDGCSLVHVEIA